MKKIAIVMITLLCMIMSLSLAACNNGGKLETPNVVISGNSLSWDPVENATGYIIKLDGKVLMTEVDGKQVENVISDTMYTFATDKKGVHTIAVKAKGQGKFTDSDYSKEMSFIVKEQLSRPVLNMTREGNKITYTWDAVPNAASYNIKIGLNLNETTAVAVPKANGTSFTIDVTTPAYKEIGEYKAKIVAISGNDNYSDSGESNTVTYINTYTIKKPTDFKCENDIFKWTSADENGKRYKITAVRRAEKEEDKAEFSNETTGTSLSYSNLKINKPGVYDVTVMAFSTGDRAVYLDSEQSNAVTITVLDAVTEFRLEGTKLFWKAVPGAKGYSITATTRKGTSFPITIESGATESYNLADNKDFRTLDRVGKMFSFDIIATGDTSKADSLVFDSEKTTSLDAGAYYQYLPVAKDYEKEDDKKGIIPTKVAEKDKEAYYPVKTYPELLWALKNADAKIMLMNNIVIEYTEFVSPITSFSGKFDGNGHTIAGIRMTPAFNRSNISIFGDNKGTIENLVVSDISIECAEANLKNGVIANKNDGTIKNVVVVAKHLSDKKSDIGMFNDTSELGIIAYENNGVISDVVVEAKAQARNIAGIAVINNKGKTITNATVYGRYSGFAGDKNIMVGSIVAHNKGKITYSLSDASVYGNTANKAKADIKAAIGGIVAINDGVIDYTYYTNGVEANCVGNVYAGGFVGINNGTITKSYVDTTSRITRLDDTSLLGGFAGQNNGTIANVYSNISFEGGYAAAVVADNTKNAIIKNVAYNASKAGKDAKVVLKGEGTVDAATVKGYQSNNFSKSVEVLGDEFVNYKGFSNVPLLSKVIYVSPQKTIITDIVVNTNLLRHSSIDFGKFYVGGKEHNIPKENENYRANNFGGYQIVKYTANVGTEKEPINVVYNRLIQVRG